ncbi:hypothetical protein [Frigoribacterium sp. UYMn621]|uniref:hypothetical protein n=1 Tax=Frigoribacterium sp. UYMn621 TaxID=3156343 RepID=UPI003397182F
MKVNDEDFDRLLAISDPARSHVVSEETLAALLQDAGVPGRRNTIRRRRRKVLGFGFAGVIVLSAAIGLPAAADVVSHFLAQTGRSCDSGTECGKSPSEFIDTTKSDFDLYVESVYPDWLPLAAPLTKESVISTVTARLHDNGGTMEASGVEMMFENVAYCSWTDAWMVAHKKGDTTAQNHAASVMRAETKWPGLIQGDGGGLVQMQEQFAAGAEAGDAIKVIEAQIANACDSSRGAHK